MSSQMTSSRPYLIRALYEWIVDNELTPYMVVNATIPGTKVPENFVENGQIVLNISPQAVMKLEINNDYIQFSAGFSGILKDIFVPMEAVNAIYAYENGRGMMFQEQEEENGPTSTTSTSTQPPPKKGRPDLKVVK